MTGQWCPFNGSDIIGILKIGGDIGDGMPEYLIRGVFGQHDPICRHILSIFQE